MMTGKDLKEMVSKIPNDAIVTFDNNLFVELTGLSIEFGSYDCPHADIKITEGFSITCDEVVDELFRDLTKSC